MRKSQRDPHKAAQGGGGSSSVSLLTPLVDVYGASPQQCTRSLYIASSATLMILTLSAPSCPFCILCGGSFLRALCSGVLIMPSSADYIGYDQILFWGAKLKRSSPPPVPPLMVYDQKKGEKYVDPDFTWLHGAHAGRRECLLTHMKPGRTIWAKGFLRAFTGSHQSAVGTCQKQRSASPKL